MTLLVLAAGMGSRYGGLKQIDPFTEDGEFIIDFSVYDAIQAGFDRVVFIIKRENLEDFKETIGCRLEGKIKVEYAFQDMDYLVPADKIPAERVKPWGTTHAILCAEDVIAGDSFAVINADDFYGRDGYMKAAEFIRKAENAEDNLYAMIGYHLGNTLSDSGSVARGVCEKNDQNMLTGVVERTEIMRVDGPICYKDEEGAWQPVGEETPVSMNFWGFTPDYFKHSEEQFVDFLKENIDKPKAEYFIPLVVNNLTTTGKASCEVLDTTAKWFGVTYAADRPATVEKIQSLVDAGEYPEKLF